MNITSVVIMVIKINTFGNQLNKKMDLHNNQFSSLHIQSEIVWLFNPGHTAPMALGQLGYLCHEALNSLMLILNFLYCPYVVEKRTFNAY